MFYSVCKNKQLFRKLQIISRKFDKLTLKTGKNSFLCLEFNNRVKVLD